MAPRAASWEPQKRIRVPCKQVPMELLALLLGQPPMMTQQSAGTPPRLLVMVGPHFLATMSLRLLSLAPLHPPVTTPKGT